MKKTIARELNKAELTLLLKNLCQSSWVISQAFGCIRAYQLDLLPGFTDPEGLSKVMAVVGKEEADKLCNLIYALEEALDLKVSFGGKPFEYRNARLPIGADIA